MKLKPQAPKILINGKIIAIGQNVKSRWFYRSGPIFEIGTDTDELHKDPT